MPPDPIVPPPKDTTVSEPSTVPSEAVEAPASEVVLPPVIDTSVVSEPPIEPTAQAPEPEKTAQPEAQNEPDSALEPAPEPAQTLDSTSSPQETAQIPANEPLKPEPTAQTPIPAPAIPEPRSRARELLTIARNAMQFRKRKKLEKILGLLEKRTSITNDEVEKLLHVSDATATRYLSTLEKEGKIKQTGKTGKSVSYSKI